MKRVASVTRAVPRGLLPHWGNVMLDVIRQEPGPGGALLQGLFFGRVAPPRSERRNFEVPTLVLGHPRDPVHPFSDAGMLAAEMPNARLIEANSLVELRLQPERLTDEIAAFLEELWGRPRAKRAVAVQLPRKSESRTRAESGNASARPRQHHPLQEPTRDARETGPHLAPLGRREDFHFADLDVAGRGGCADGRRRGLADPHHQLAEAHLGLAQFEAGAGLFDRQRGATAPPSRGR